jgi:hypothetical protein
MRVEDASLALLNCPTIVLYINHLVVLRSPLAVLSSVTPEGVLSFMAIKHKYPKGNVCSTKSYGL